MSLNEFGRELELHFHADLHMLWSNGDPCKHESDRTQLKCDGLVPGDSSPVNPHFWKLHGLIDNMLGDWLTANGYQHIAEDCTRLSKCYQWQGTWMGKRPSFEIQ